MSIDMVDVPAAQSADDSRVKDYCSTLDEMKESMAAVREVVKSLQEKCVFIIIIQHITHYLAQSRST